jgi:ADP-heptose:LPS heptosyltransferase
MPLIERPGVHIFGLQKGEEARQTDNVSCKFSNLGPEFDSFADTAGAIHNLDLVISVDTAVAHLAGAMAKPVWVLLPYAADWKWFLERPDSPWYPTMRLFRQPRPGDWSEVIKTVVHELEQFFFVQKTSGRYM